MGLFDWLRKKQETPQPTPRELFAREVIEALERVPGVTLVTPLTDPYGLVVKIGDKETRSFLENTFVETRDVDPAERKRRIALLVQSALVAVEAPPSWEEVQPMLRLALRAVVSTRLEWTTAKPMVAREVLPALRSHLVIDHPTSLSYVTSEQLAEWGASEEQAFDIARSNMLAFAQHGLAVYDESPSRIWHVEAGDDYEAARLVVPDFLASFRGKVEGDPVAIVPERASLFIAGDRNPQTVLRLCEMATREYAASPRCISAAIYGLDASGNVIPYVAPPGSPAETTVREAHLQFVGGEYTMQKAELEEVFAAENLDLFVASFTLVGHPQRGAFSYSTWTLDVETLLPETDFIAVNAEPRPVFVRASAVHRIAAAYLTREPRLFPPRWRTALGVPPAVVAELQAHAEAI